LRGVNAAIDNRADATISDHHPGAARTRESRTVADDATQTDKTPPAGDATDPAPNVGMWIGAGVGAGIGSAALAAALLYATRNRKKRSAAKD